MKKIIAFILILSFQSLNVQAAHLVQLLDQVYEAQRYWAEATTKNQAYFWKSSLAAFKNIFKEKKWHTIINKHQLALKKQEKELITLLAEYTEKKIADLNIQKIIIRHKESLKQHKAPSHFTRNWITYTGITATCAALGLYLSHFHNAYTLFIIDPQAPSLLTALQNNSPFLGHDYVNYKGQQYLQVTKSQEELARQFLEHRFIRFSIDSPDKRLSFYNEQGVTRFWEFIDLHGIQPIQKIIKILKNEAPTELPLLSTDPQADQLMFLERLNPLLQMAFEHPTTKPIVENFLQQRDLSELSFAEKNTLFTRLILFMPEKGSEQLKLIFTQFRAITEGSFFSISIARNLIEALARITDENAETIILASQIFTLRVQQKELQIGAAIHQMNMFAERARLNLELSAMIPLLITTYGCYKFVHFLYKKVAHKTFKIIKKDLISFELLLNKNRYTDNKDNTDYKGLSYYWTFKLLQHIDHLPCEQKFLYKDYIMQLKSNDLCAEQKLTIIDCMFKELSFLNL